MDIFPYLFDVMLTVVAVYWFVTNRRRQPGSPTTGLFRYHEILKQSGLKPAGADRPARYRLQPVNVADTAQIRASAPNDALARVEHLRE